MECPSCNVFQAEIDCRYCWRCKYFHIQMRAFDKQQKEEDFLFKKLKSKRD